MGCTTMKMTRRKAMASCCSCCQRESQRHSDLALFTLRLLRDIDRIGKLLAQHQSIITLAESLELSEYEMGRIYRMMYGQLRGATAWLKHDAL